MTDYIIQILPSMIEGLGVSAEIFALTLVPVSYTHLDVYKRQVKGYAWHRIYQQ